MIHRVQRVLLPYLRDEHPGVTFSSWTADVDTRTFPLVLIRREGGTALDVERFDRPNVEISAMTSDGLVETEELYNSVRLSVFRMVRSQTSTPFGYLHSFTEVLGPTQVDSPFDDTWRVMGLIRLGLRPART